MSPILCLDWNNSSNSMIPQIDMFQESETANLIAQVSDNAKDIESLKHRLDHLKLLHQNLSNEATKSENHLKTIIAQVAIILKVVAIEDGHVSEAFQPLPAQYLRRVEGRQARKHGYFDIRFGQAPSIGNSRPTPTR